MSEWLDSELKPCPFCGGEALHTEAIRKAVSDKARERSNIRGAKVVCLTCLANTGFKETIIAAHFAWNRRAGK